MKKVMIIGLILAGLLLIPAVSAEILIDEDINTYDQPTALLSESMHDWIDTGGRGTTNPAGSSYTANFLIDSLYFTDITKVQTLNYVVYQCDGHHTPLSEGTHPFTYELDGVTRSGTCHVDLTRNVLGVVTSTKISLFFDDFDIGYLTGAQRITLDIVFLSADKGYTEISNPDNLHILPQGKGDVYQVFRHVGLPLTITISSGILWDNEIVITEIAPSDLQISLKRVFDPKYYMSTLIISDKDDNIIYESTENTNVDVVFPARFVNTVNVTSPSGRSYVYPIGVGSPDTITIYVRNSQTGALLSDSHIIISARIDDEFDEVINRTLPGGTYKGTLQPTGGGMPNPDYYRLIASADGYNPIMPYMDFEHGGATTLFVEMEPTSGSPVNENNTFVEFYVRDISANAVANAKVQVGGYTLWTNAQGYTQFEVPKNASYPYIVTKTGYLTIEGIATVESDDRYIVNVALMSGAIPTQPTPTPTITVESTPTSPIQEDNLIGLSVKGLAKGFGIDYDTALLMFGLMIVFGAGGIVMSSVKGGAMEFIAGSIVGTFVAFALGLIPIWIFIIIAVVFGAYVLRVFIQGGQ